MIKKLYVTVVTLLTAMVLAGNADAHHAASAYNHDTPITVGGTVKEFRWSNPHTWISVEVPLGNGEVQEWNLEGTSVNTLVRAGWTKQTLQPGMIIKLLVSPRRDGAPGGEWNKVISINGEPFTPPVAEQ